MKQDDVTVTSEHKLGWPRWGSSPDGLTRYIGPLHVIFTVSGGTIPDAADRATEAMHREQAARIPRGRVALLVVISSIFGVLMYAIGTEILGVSDRIAYLFGGVLSGLVGTIGFDRLFRNRSSLA